MGYLEQQLGLPPGEYSPTLLEIDAESGPWLTECQRSSPVARGGYTHWDLDLEQGELRFGDGQRTALVARVEVLGTYSPTDKVWLWAWSNPSLEERCLAAASIRDEHEHVPEFVNPTFPCTETKAWSVAAAAAYRLGAQACYRLPGEIQLLVALFDMVAMGRDQGGDVEADPGAALEALSQYAGPASLALGGQLLDCLRQEARDMDQVLAQLYQFCDNLGQLAESPVGRGTPAAAEALELSTALRNAAMYLSVPPGSPMLPRAAENMLTLLKQAAQRHGAWAETADGPRP